MDFRVLMFSEVGWRGHLGYVVVEVGRFVRYPRGGSSLAEHPFFYLPEDILVSSSSGLNYCLNTRP
jgi:hypothetical protein